MSNYPHNQAGKFRKDYVGARFSDLTVIYYEGAKKWVCQCDCGKRKAVMIGNLKTGATTSCGCVAKKALVKRSTKHGKAERSNLTPEYQAWKGIRKRIFNPKDAAYLHYGGRGIRLCDRWKESFEFFLADMGEKPTPKHSVERRDNDGDYCPENCYWATPLQQSRNTSRSRKVDYKGQVKTVSEWAETLNINYMTLFTRLYRGNMTVEQAMETPVGGKPL